MPTLLLFNLLVILGPTASGKTRVGVDVAHAVQGEIISADSRQVYRSMDIGTGKDLKEYEEIPYHLIDIVDPGGEFSVFDFQRCFSVAFPEILERGRLPILVGGTGLYLDSVLMGYRMPEVPPNPPLREKLEPLSTGELAERLKSTNSRLHNTTDLLDRERLIRAIEVAEFGRGKEERVSLLPRLFPLVFGIRWPREALRERITQRLRKRLKEGMIDEVKRLLASGVSYETLNFYGLEYRYVSQFLQGRLNRNDMFQKLNSAIHRFAKKQETWFRRMERQGVEIHWVEGSKNPSAMILDFLRHSYGRNAVR